MTLKNLLKTKRISQSDVALTLGLQQSAVSKKVNGALKLDASEAARIGKLTGTNPIPKTDGSFSFRR